MTGFRLGSPFSSHMVLQRDSIVPIWGVDAPGGTVLVKAGDRTWSAVADSTGRWRADIGPFPAGGPYTIIVKGTGEVTLEDVLAGEVWLASGQSNMEWPLNASSDGMAEIARASEPEIRFLSIPRNGTPEPVDFVENAGWTACTPESASGFSAVAYYFAREIHDRLQVPVGIVSNPWGGATMESYTSLESLAADPMLAWNVAEFDKYQQEREAPDVKAFNESMRLWVESTGGKGYHEDKGDEGQPLHFENQELDDSSWKPVVIPDTVKSEVGAIDGAFWFRREVNLPASWSGRELVLNLAIIDSVDIAYVNGTEVGRTGSDVPGFWASNRQYPVAPGVARAGRNIIALRIFEQSWDGGIFLRPRLMSIAPKDSPGEAIPLTGEWKYKVTKELPMKPKSPLREERDIPAMLYNGMICPIAPFRFRGVIWYQGESNAGRPEQYHRLTEVMLGDWRRLFEQPELPFLYVQLAGFVGESPGWVNQLHAQLHCLDIPFTAMATAVDIGTEDDVHPRNKKDVGHRLSLIARALIHGEQIEYYGPTLASASVDGGAVRLDFNHTGSGLVSRTGGSTLEGFEIAGADEKYVTAQARVDGRSVVVHAAGVSKPAFVRHAWKDFTTVDFYNRDGLPCSPFKTAVPVADFVVEAFRAPEKPGRIN